MSQVATLLASDENTGSPRKAVGHPSRPQGSATARLADVDSKYQIDELPPLFRAGRPLHPTCSSSYFLQISQTWDRLQAINVFISASSGQRFLAEFLEVGGVLTVLEVLNLPQVKESDKAEALRVLLCVANAGRRYKEFICESYGVRAVADCLARSRSEITQDYARNLLYQLGMGNPKFLMQVYKALLSLLTTQASSPTAQQLAGQALRMLLPSIPAVHPSIVEATIALLKSPHIQIQYEGYEILRELIRRPPLQEVILAQLISILKVTVEDVQEESPDDRRRRQKAVSEGKTLTAGQWGFAKGDEMKAQSETTAASYVQQAYAAKLSGVMAATYNQLAGRMIELQVVSGLLNVIANVGHPDSQRYAASTLLYLVDEFDNVAQALREHMGQNFFELLETQPDTFYKELTRDQVRYLRRNTVRVHAADTASIMSDSDVESISSDDDEAAAPSQRQTKRRSARTRSRPATAGTAMQFPSSREGDARPAETIQTEAKPDTGESARDKEKTSSPGVAEEGKDQAPTTPLVQDMYVSFGQAGVHSTFSGNKFVPAQKVDSKEKFNHDLEDYRAANANIIDIKKERGRKEEFPEDDQTIKWLSDKKNDADLFKKNKMALDTGSETPNQIPAKPRESAMESEASTVLHDISDQEQA
ncbi:hypothetical protein HK097_000574 [Rhizophlyctis rosea]|uniref:Uncharacterized protein n=1 Tax=Rhizophlyctis rosea TaxID=64517 RepID=A0AAD5SLF7_9FUNG|nr:hypothetical protein HK097_000574 [Rhizophlyctis rosea]